MDHETRAIVKKLQTDLHKNGSCVYRVKGDSFNQLLGFGLTLSARICYAPYGISAPLGPTASPLQPVP